jgi:hypothetical protein
VAVDKRVDQDATKGTLRVVRRPFTALAVALGLSLSGCGGPSDRATVRATLADLARATAQRDYGRMCRQILAPRLVAAVTQVGLPCETALAQGLGHVATPKLVVRGVSVHDRTALARVHTTAANQPSSDDTVRLVKLGDRWYVESLVPAAKPRT